MSSTSSSSRNRVPALVTETWTQLEALECTNSLKLLSEVRQIAEEFQHKTQLIEQNVAESQGDMLEKLDSLKKCKRDLLTLKEAVILMKHEYLASAQETVRRFQEIDPNILEKFETVSMKLDKLQRLKLEKEGRELIEKLEGCAESGHLDDTLEALNAALAHEEKCTNFDSTSKWLSSDLSTTCERLFASIKVMFSTHLEKDLKFPFEEGGCNTISKDKLAVLHKYLQLLRRLQEHVSPDDWTTEVAEALFSPIQNRFHYHFYGDRRTNDVSNPRWFLTQISSWIRANSSFFEQVLSPIKNVNGFNPSVFFQYRMSTLASEKIKSLLALDEVIADSFLFSRLIDDCVEFEEGRQQLDALNHGSNCLAPFCEKSVIMVWIEMENEISTAFLDEILAAEMRWKKRLGEIDDVDEYLVCNCADSFVTHVLCIQNRSRLLPDSLSKRGFIDLQLFLFDEFRERLSQIANIADSPWLEPFPQIMNAIWYLYDTLKEWSETNALDDQGAGMAALENTSSMYKHLWSQLADRIAISIRIQTTDLAQQYRHNKWASVDAFALNSKEISPFFCPLLQKIRSIFASAGNVLSQVSLKTAFDRFTTVVAEVLWSEVLQNTAFVESGASQMLFDVQDGLVPVLNNIFDRNEVAGMQCGYNKTLIKVISALRLLSLPWPVATLLREEMSNNSPEQFEEKLLEIKVTCLSLDEVEQLFSQRHDMKNSSLMTIR